MLMRLQSGVQILSSNIVLISFFIMATQIPSFYRKRTSVFKMGVNCLKVSLLSLVEGSKSMIINYLSYNSWRKIALEEAC